MRLQEFFFVRSQSGLVPHEWCGASKTRRIWSGTNKGTLRTDGQILASMLRKPRIENFMTAINNSCKIHYLWEPYTGFFHIPQLRTKRNMPDFIMYHSTVGTRLCIIILRHFLWCLIIRSCLLLVRLLFSSHSSSFWCDSLWLHRLSTCSCLLFWQGRKGSIRSNKYLQFFLLLGGM